MIAGNAATSATVERQSARAWYAVGVLVLAYVFSIMDRQILTVMVGPIQKSLGVNDTMMGLLHGFTFAAFYSIMGFPIARMIDRGHRPVILAIGIAMWSLATAAGGLATEYWHLFVARIGVAVGEAVLIPGAVSLLGDLFTAEKRSRAMGIFGAAGPVGAGMGLLAGGILLGIFTAAPPVLPGIGALTAWQATFIAVGLPGVVVALMVLLVPEPRRNRARAGLAAPAVPVRAAVEYVRTNRRTFAAVILGTGFFYTGTYAWAAWTPTFFVRELGWTYPQIGKVMGIVLVVAGPLGTVSGVWLADRLRQTGVGHANLRVAMLACAGMASATTLMVFGGSTTVSVVALIAAAMLCFVPFGLGSLMIQECSPVPIRGQLAALFTGVLNIIGVGLGPVLAGAITDYGFRDPAMIGASLVLTCVTSSLIGLVLFRRGVVSYAKTCDHAAHWHPDASADDMAGALPAVPTTTR
ncbi:MAG: MFS transporter [Paracoccus sp. (in: a-proteobacteria)]|nr:MFS transporter [Paracoccus sp. (in: a-proteobacteria)]